MMARLSLLSWLLSTFIIHIAYGQQRITVPVRVEGMPFNVTFRPDLVKSTDLATELCNRNYDAFNLQSLGVEVCVEPLEQYFQTVIDEYNSQLSMKVSVRVEGNDFNVAYRPDRITATTMASRLCSENAEILGVTESSLVDCVNPVARYLTQAESQFITQRTLAFPVTVNGNDYNLRFRIDLVSAMDVAKDLCYSRAEEIGVNAKTVSSCIQPAAQYIQSMIDQWFASRTIKLSLQVNGIDFNIEIQPDIESAIDAAQQICYLGERVNVTAAQIPECVDGIVLYIRESYTTAVMDLQEGNEESSLPMNTATAIET